MSIATEAGHNRVGTPYWEFLPGLIKPGLAEAAGEAALKFMSDDALPFMYRATSYRVRVGAWAPGSQYSRNSILANQVAAQCGPALVKVFDMAAELGFSVADESGWDRQPTLTRLIRWSSLDLHQDLISQDRLVINLSKHRNIMLEDESGEAVYIDQLLGDGYILHCTEDESTSPWHGVEAPIAPSTALLFGREI